MSARDDRGRFAGPHLKRLAELAADPFAASIYGRIHERAIALERAAADAAAEREATRAAEASKPRTPTPVHDELERLRSEDPVGAALFEQNRSYQLKREREAAEAERAGEAA